MLICKRIINAFGADMQIEMVIEESSEAILAIQKYKRGLAGHYSKKTSEELLKDLQGEAADLLIVASQLAIIAGESEVRDIVQFKMNRVLERVEQAESQKLNQ